MIWTYLTDWLVYVSKTTVAMTQLRNCSIPVAMNLFAFTAVQRTYKTSQKVYTPSVKIVTNHRYHIKRKLKYSYICINKSGLHKIIGLGVCTMFMSCNVPEKKCLVFNKIHSK